jgi:hypothetical protein
MLGSRSFSTPAADPASTDAFADVLMISADPKVLFAHVMAESGGQISADWKNTGANSIDSRVLGSNDLTLADADWEVIVASAAIAAAASRHVHITPTDFLFYKFQQKATVGASQGASKIRGAVKSSS